MELGTFRLLLPFLNLLPSEVELVEEFPLAEELLEDLYGFIGTEDKNE